MKGIGFPDIPDSQSGGVQEWIKVLQRISNEGGEGINAVRIYRPPACAVDEKSTCFEAFMREADRLGIYVLISGSGTQWGWFPGQFSACTGGTLQGCYEAGKILQWGRAIVQKFNYPNTLGIVIANEIEQNIKALPVLKAYARDLKAHMQMCNTDQNSLTNGKMRQIPLLYAATDKPSFLDQADYLFCGDAKDSIDAYGLNIERWVSDAGGKPQYDIVNGQVKNKNWPGAFIYSEEAGPYKTPDPGRTWNQLPNFFGNWPAIDGFSSYTYYGNSVYNMFDGPTADAKEYQDGKTFFSKIAQIGADPASQSPVYRAHPPCQGSFTQDGQTFALSDYSSIQAYDTPNSSPASCPKPWQNSTISKLVV
jgi:hypothetical protein